MSGEGKSLPPRKKPPLRVPEMDHSLGELNPVNIAGKFSQRLLVLLYCLVLSPFQASISNEGSNSLQFAPVNPNPMGPALLNNDPGYFREVLPVHEGSASNPRDVLYRIPHGSSHISLGC